MADFLTHILLADSVIQRIEKRRIMEGVISKRSLYYLGAQGPDPFFFYDIFNKKGPLKGLGRIMHRQSTGKFLLNGFSALQNVSYDENWLGLAVYLCGFICHFTLDRLLHPYIYWATSEWIWTVDGFFEKSEHSEIEMALDVMLWYEKKGRRACKQNIRKMIDIGAKWPQSIAALLMDSIENIYGIEVSIKELNKVLASYYRGNDLLYDPVGWKTAIINFFEALTGGGIKPPKKPYPAEYNKNIDWANRKKRTWKDPFLKGAALNSSVDEIIIEAENIASSHINEIFSRIYRNESIENLFPDLSYITGQLCTYNSEE
ncbi:MAG: zinc dependent phospholipase C family protein [Clostridiaceae bacterium]|nr:zinc dependent phospholipase C family protein [Clostridiaceae bacterium]